MDVSQLSPYWGHEIPMKSDIVDTFFHASAWMRHNMYKQSLFTTLWERGHKGNGGTGHEARLME
jgi:hypothetical protein